MYKSSKVINSTRYTWWITGHIHEVENTQKQPCVKPVWITTSIHELWMTIKWCLGIFIRYPKRFNRDKKDERAKKIIQHKWKQKQQCNSKGGEVDTNEYKLGDGNCRKFVRDLNEHIKWYKLITGTRKQNCHEQCKKAENFN